MQIDVKVEGLERIDRASKAARESIARELAIGLYACAKKVEGDAKRSITDGEKTGRIYRRRTIEHRASAPGEAPASDTGRLVNSINGTVEKSTTLEAVIRAGGGIVKYARMLEFGTSKMGARPFLFPAAEKNRGWIRDRLSKSVREALIKVVRR